MRFRTGQEKELERIEQKRQEYNTWEALHLPKQEEVKDGHCDKN